MTRLRCIGASLLLRSAERAACPWRNASPAATREPGMKRPPSGTAVPAALVALLLAACAAPPVEPQAAADDVPPLPTTTAPAQTDYEQRQRERAVTLARQGRLADAALTWEILGVLRPDVPEYGEQLAHARRQIESAGAERLQRAQQAHKRGEWEAATQWYLSVLALQPDHALAADALRTLERERNKRTHLNKFARVLTPVPRPASPPKARGGSNPAAPAAPPDRNELEHAAMLTVQGEYDDAIVLLERRLTASRQDEVARALLADAYFQKAEEIAAADKAGAIAALEKSVRLYPTHPLAADRLKQLKGTAPAAAASGAMSGASSPRAATTKGTGRVGRRSDHQGAKRPQ
jgi:tetratricopeptide (TPR) repeat protein